MNQEQKVKNHLEQVGSLSGREANDIYRIVDLPSRVSALNKQGVAVKGVWKTDISGKRYKRYFLEGELNEG